MTEFFKPGDRFRVAETQEVRNGKGALLARYLPDFDYAVTARNLEAINVLLAQGKASPAAGARDRAANRAASAAARVQGTVSTKAT